MNKDTFEKANELLKVISEIETQMSLVKKMKVRKNDKEFNDLRSGYYGALGVMKQKLEDNFKNL